MVIQRALCALAHIIAGMLWATLRLSVELTMTPRTHPNGLSLVPGFFPMHSNRKRRGTQLMRPGIRVSCATGDSLDYLNLLPKGSCSVLIVHVVKDTRGR